MLHLLKITVYYSQNITNFYFKEGRQLTPLIDSSDLCLQCGCHWAGMFSDCLYLCSETFPRTLSQARKEAVMIKVTAHTFQKALYRSTEICLGSIRRAILSIKTSVTGDQQDIKSHFPWIPTTRKANA